MPKDTGICVRQVRCLQPRRSAGRFSLLQSLRNVTGQLRVSNGVLFVNLQATNQNESTPVYNIIHVSPVYAGQTRVYLHTLHTRTDEARRVPINVSSSTVIPGCFIGGQSKVTEKPWTHTHPGHPRDFGRPRESHQTHPTTY